MRHDLSLSILLHAVIVLIMVISSPFKPQVRVDLGNIIKVNLASLPPSMKLGQAKAAVVPQAVAPKKTATPVADNKTKAKPIDKTKTKAKKKEEPKTQSKLSRGMEQVLGDETGRKDVTEDLGIGSAFSGAAIDNASFDYPYWFVQAFNKIERNWSNPVYANQPLSCIIYFQVIRSGKIIQLEIEQSSGIETFDRACERAVRLSEPLPPLPGEFIDEIIGIHLEFPYIPR